MARASWVRPQQTGSTLGARRARQADHPTPADHSPDRTPGAFLRFRAGCGPPQWCASVALLRLDAGFLHDLRPALELALDEGVERERRTADDIGRLRAGDGVAHRRHLEDVVEDAVDAR